MASAIPVYSAIVFYLTVLISVVASSEGDTLIEPTPKIRGNPNFELIQPSYVPIADFELVFQNSLLLFRGDTTIFDFQVVQQFFIPILHVVLMDSRAKNSTFVYRQIGLFKMTMTLRKFVHRQYMLHGVGLDCENMHLRWRKWGAGRGISWDDGFIDLYPMNILVFTTLQTQRFYDSCVLTDEYYFWKGISKLNFVFFYDTEAEKRRDCYVICYVCKSEKQDSIWRNDKKKVRKPVGSVWRSWDETNVLLLMEEMRNNVSGNGRNIHWKAPDQFQRHYIHLIQIFKEDLSEFESNIIGIVKIPAILRQRIFQIAVLIVLFQSEPKDHSPLEIRFTEAQVSADNIIFISSEEVKYREGDSPLDFYLSIIDVSIWISLGTAIIITSSFYSVTRLLSLVPGKEGTAPEVATVHKIRIVSCEFLAMFNYLSMAFLAQFPRDLPSCNQKNVRYVTKSRLFLIPWIFGTAILTNWYSAFIESSFKFPFPYELKQGHWRDFENYSVYLLINQKHVLVVEDTHDPNWITGSFAKFIERFQLELDMNDTILEIRLIEDEDLPGYQPLRSGFAEASLGGDCGLASQSESSPCAEQKNLHPFFIWFKREWLRIKNCSHDSSYVEDLGSQNPCFRDKKAIDKIRYRIDSIDYRQLSWYVGRFYQNLTEVARKIGTRLLKKFPDDYEYEASSQRQREERMYVKESFVQIDNINESITSTTSMKSAINTFYWMTRRQQAVFVVKRTEFPWYWNLFKNLMNQNRTLKFAHTGPKSLKNLRPDRGLTGNGFESPIQINGTSKAYLPEAKWMQWRIRALTHSGILGFLAKWDLLLYPPVEGRMKFFEEIVTDAVPLYVTHDSVKASFIVLFTGVAVAVVVLAAELILNAAFI